jgi:hypothetical protein
LPLDLLSSIDLRKYRRSNACVWRDYSSGELTLTFEYAAGEPEIAFALDFTDWSRFRALSLVFSASSQEPLAIGFSNGRRTRRFVMEPLAGVRIRAVIPFDAFVQNRQLTPLAPLGYAAFVERVFHFNEVRELSVKMRFPNQTCTVLIQSLELTEDVSADEILDRRCLIDRYGQWIGEEWPGKVHNDSELKQLWREDVVHPIEHPFCPVGGDTTRSLESTGFFRTERIDGRWMLIDPHGHPFFSIGMDLVGYNPDSFATRVTGREYLFEELPEGGPPCLSPGVVSFYVANIMRRFGPDWRDHWRTQIVERLRAWGVNTIGNWSDPALAVSSGMPYVLPLGGWTTNKAFPFPYDFPDVFSEEFEVCIDEAVRRQCVPLRDEPLLIGWFLGNEPAWARGFEADQSWAETVLSDPEDSATKRRLQSLIASAGQDGAREFLYDCAQKYFEVITASVRKHDPNHLVLGVRFAGQPHSRFVQMSSLFDVFSVNIYTADFAPDPELIRHYSAACGKPVLIGEFTACAPERGLQGLFYFTHKVRDQAERATAYRYFVEKAAATPEIIGAHWFQLVDDLPTGRPADGERLNYGFLSVVDVPYSDLIIAAAQTHARVYDLCFGKIQPVRNRPRMN